MKKLFALCSVILLLLISCSKDDGKDVVDCFGEGLLMNVTHTVENENVVNFQITYNGSHILKNTVIWDFGGGNVETITGTTATHAYLQSGSYEVKANVSLVSPDCTFALKEDVTIN